MAMNVDWLRELCLSFPHATEQIQWGSDLLFKVGGKMFAATLYYKLNPWCTFGTEYSVYASRLAPGSNYSIAGSLSNEWQDHRIEFGPVFTF